MANYGTKNDNNILLNRGIFKRYHGKRGTCIIREELPLEGISDSEVLFLGYLAVADFNGNYSKAHYYGMGMKLLSKVEYSRFTRRINQLEEEIKQLFLFLSELFTKLNASQSYSVDSFPVEICQIQREKRSKLWRDVSLKGYNS